MTLASGGGGGPIFSLVVRQLASPSIWPVVQCNVGAVEEMVCVVCVVVAEGA